MTLAVLTVLPAFALIGYNNWRHRASDEAHAKEAVLRIAQNTSNRFGYTIGETRRWLTALSHLPVVRNPSHPHCSQTLAVMNERLPQYASLGVVIADGTVSCHALPFDRATPPSAADRLDALLAVSV
jgi:hypothetical protein